MSLPPHRMKTLALRRLTDAERAIAAEVFKGSLQAGRVRLLAAPVWPRAFVAGPRLMVWPAAGALRDFGRAPLRLQAVFVHELTHVWQAQRGVFLPIAKLRAGDSPAAYAYDLTGARAFADLNIEQQAMAVQHAFLTLRGHAAPHPAELCAQALEAVRRT